jgi:hypothetical protein
MITLEKIITAFEEEELLKADGFDEAVIGIDYDKMRLIYSVAKVIEILKKEMNADDAWEHFAFNIAGADVGEKTPIWCYDLFE